MNRWIVLGGLCLVAFLLGLLSAGTAQGTAIAREPWVPTQLPDRSWESQALERLAAGDRWELVLQSSQEGGPGGEFASDYRLVAVVESGSAYALLERLRIGTPVTDTILKVTVGDELADGWKIADIQRAAVVATRKEESQRVELFPSD